MNCKNCQNSLLSDYKYCPECGVKTDIKRLTFQGLFNDVVERVFNLENNVFRTIGQLTVRPERVIISYLEGTRRKYLNPLNYLTLTLFLSGVIFFFIRRFALDKMKFDVAGLETNVETSRKIMEAVMEYNSFVFILYIPILALAGFLSFNKRRLNIPEYIVTSTYALSHLMVLTFPISLMVILMAPEKYMTYSLLSLTFMIGYPLFVLIRMHRYSIGMAIVRSILFIVLFLIGYLGISIALNLLLLLTGQLTLQDFAPPPA